MGADEFIDDALKTTRNVHRLFITVSLITLVFSLSLRAPGDLGEQLRVVQAFLQFDFVGAYERQLEGALDSALKAERKATLERLQAELAEITGPLWNPSELIEAIGKPVALRETTIRDSILADPEGATLKALDALWVALHLDADEAFALLQTDRLIVDIQHFLQTRAAQRSRISSLSVRPFELDGVHTIEEGDRIKVLVYFELIPEGGPPAPVFEGTYDAVVRVIPRSSYSHWLLSRPDSARFLRRTTTGVEWLPALRTLSSSVRSRKVVDVEAVLMTELREADPARRTVSLLGADVPGFLLAYAAPLALFGLAAYLLGHVAHVARFATTHGREFGSFAWLPFALQRAWIIECASTLVVLPAAALGTLASQLFRFGLLSAAGVSVLAIALTGTLIASTLAVQKIAAARREAGLRG